MKSAIAAVPAILSPVFSPSKCKAPHSRAAERIRRSLSLSPAGLVFVLAFISHGNTGILNDPHLRPLSLKLGE